jgi:hypothetical protein
MGLFREISPVFWFSRKVIAKPVVNTSEGKVSILVSEDVTNWLLEPEDPSMRYRTLVEFLSRSPNDHEAIECKRDC